MCVAAKVRCYGLFAGDGERGRYGDGVVVGAERSDGFGTVLFDCYWYGVLRWLCIRYTF